MTSLSQPTEQQERPLSGKQGNRIHATKRLNEEMVRARKDPQYQFSAVLIQFDGMTDTGDQLGYAAREDGGHRAMSFLTQDLRPEHLCCRLSTDEFILILSAQGHAAALGLVERLRDRWQPAPASRDAEIQLNIGIASYPTHGCRIEELLRTADEALDADRLHNELLRAAQPRQTALPH